MYVSLMTVYYINYICRNYRRMFSVSPDDLALPGCDSLEVHLYEQGGQLTLFPQQPVERVETCKLSRDDVPVKTSHLPRAEQLLLSSSYIN